MSDSRRFPILWPVGVERMFRFAEMECPRDIPWDIMAVHAGQAYLNHDQTLEELAERGGLEPSEVIAVLESRPWTFMHDDTAVPLLRRMVGLPAVKRSH